MAGIKTNILFIMKIIKRKCCITWVFGYQNRTDREVNTLKNYGKYFLIGI